MSKDPGVLLASGRKALAAGDWTAARDAFQAVLDQKDAPEAWHGLGEASWWLGDLEGTVNNFERAYTAFRHRPDPGKAAEMAIRNALHAFMYFANETATAGWLGRAKRLIDENGLDDLRGELLVMESFFTADPVTGEGYAREALELARRAGNPDLELCSLSSIGAALVRQGRVEEGLSLLDEAMAGALSGEGGRLETVVFTSCDLMTSCARCAAFERAVECVRSAERFARRYGCPFLYSECRVIYGEVLLAMGDWPAAESELETAIALSRDSIPAYQAWATAALAELRLAQGRVEEAKRLISGFDGFPAAAPVCARIQILHGDVALAASILQRRLDALGEKRIESVRLVEMLGEVEIAQGNHDAAAKRGSALADLGASLGCRLATARGERLLGQALVPNDTATARRHLDLGLAAFVQLNMPYETARTRLMLAEALEKHEPPVAKVEARAALTLLDELGAAREADAAAGLLRRLGERFARPSPKGLQPLTKREREVFALLGEGLSNPEISRRLFISRKTVEHHVGHILDKLGLKNRAEAAAEAVRLFFEKSGQK